MREVDERSVLTVGESMSLFSAERAGRTSRGDEFRLSLGGAESNVAIGLVRLGVRAAWIGRIGDDDLGRMIVRELRSEGIDVFPIVDVGAPTALMIKHRRTDQHQRVDYFRRGSAGSRLSPSDVPAEAISSARLIHLTGITPALSGSARATVETIVATPGRAEISFDVNYRAALWSRHEASQFARWLLPHVRIVFAGLAEAELVLGYPASAEAAARGLVQLGAREAVIKLGGGGAIAFVDGHVVSASAVPIAVVDSVGAGDAFVAGYLSEWLHDDATEQCLATANAAGAFACLSHGDWEGYPTVSELVLLEAADPVTR